MTQETQEMIVGVSISNSPDLAKFGLGQEHLNEMMVSVARTVLHLGTKDRRVSLAYGGDLRPGGFLKILFPLARGEDPSLREEWNGLLYSVLAWPYYLDLTKPDEAELINSCRFVRVTPADAGLKGVESDMKPADKDAPEVKYQVSRCLSRMRAMMTSGEAFAQDGEQPRPPDGEQRRPLAARIIMGGQTTGYSGFMPGLLEEFLLAIQQNVPTYVVGAFSGIAGWLAKALLGDIPVDAQFTLEYQLAKEENQERRLPELIETYGQHEADGVKQPKAYYEELREILERARKHSVADTLRNGLSPDDNQRLMRSDREAEILGLLEKGLRSVLG